MRKEVIIAAFVGILLGCTIAFGVWRANVYFSQKGGAATSQNSRTEGENDQKKSSLLALTNVEDLDVVTQSPFTISGITQADTLVAISTEADDYLFFTDKKGVFEGKIDLAPGLDKLSITVLSDGKKLAETELSIIYSSEFAKEE